MAIYDKFADAPDRLKIEGQEITVKLVRNGDGTATIKWDIPNISGCEIEDLVYDGIIITVSDRPANYITTSPQNGVYYNADPTFDKGIHSGDNINVANVVGAFYHDRSTTSIVVADVVEKTAYYVSAYAVDQQGNYFREGTHAYSIPTGDAELDKTEGELPAYQDIQIDTPDGLSPNSKTGLTADVNYTLKVDINGSCHEFTDLLGSDMQTYTDIAETINRRFKLLVQPVIGPIYPNQGKYMVVVGDSTVNEWTGSENAVQSSIFLAADPAVPVVDTYWYMQSTDVLKVRNVGGWATVSSTAIVKYATNPSMPTDGMVWFDKAYDTSGNLDTENSTAWVYQDGTWCQQPLMIQAANPLLPPVLTVGDYWYSDLLGSVGQRQPSTKSWVEVDPIVWDTDPNTISDSKYWYDSTNAITLVRISSLWESVTNIRYEERNASGSLDSPVANHYWFVPSEQSLYQRSADNLSWIEINVIISAMDPLDRGSCNIWWNVSVGVDTLFVWDAVNSEWDGVNSFTQSSDDPSSPALLAAGTIWFHPDTEVMQSITGVNCTPITPICTSYDPLALPVGYIWSNTTTSTWHVWNGTAFDALAVLSSETDPYGVTDGIFWYGTTTDILNLRVAGAWVEQVYTTGSLAPAIDTYYLDPISYDLTQWNGIEWVASCGIAKVEVMFERNVCFDGIPNANADLFSPFNDYEKYGRDLFRFSTCGTGCEMQIAIDTMSTVFIEIDKPIIRMTPANGTSVNSGGPSFRELGVGTDGTPDERRRLQDQIRVALGSVGTTVELTKQQLDECIDNALLMIRKYSSYAYERSFFFLDLVPNQQRYKMTNKCVGFHKIVNITAGYRMRAGFFGGSQGGVGGGDIFGHAAFQQLYSQGSFDMLSFHLVSSYMEELQFIFADQLVFDFYEDTRMLNFHQTFRKNERVLLDAMIEVPEQRLMTNRYLELWIKKWAIAEAKMILSQIRGKFQSLPGPNGSTVLNSQELITQGENEKVELREELHDRSMQDHNSDVSSQFYIG